jgi:hypothetical protein
VRLLKLLFFFGSIILISSCFPKVDTSSDVEGLYQGDRLWDGARAEVCFSDDSPGTDDFRKKVKRIIHEEFNERTVFKFSGFELCSKIPNAQIEVKVLGNGRSSSGVGDSIGLNRKILSHFFPFLKKRSPMHLHLKNESGVLKDAIIIRNTIIHEFGHAAGLEHEQRRGDNQNGIFCSDTSGGGIANPNPGNIQVGSFDKLSVMNYCRPNYFSQEVSLSQGDIDTIAFAYRSKVKSLSERTKNSNAVRTSILRCDEDLLQKCAQGNGGSACIANFCGSGSYICENREKLAICLHKLGGGACLRPNVGNCH